MNLISILAGGMGSGCHGPNCGRPKKHHASKRKFPYQKLEISLSGKQRKARVFGIGGSRTVGLKYVSKKHAKELVEILSTKKHFPNARILKDGNTVAWGVSKDAIDKYEKLDEEQEKLQTAGVRYTDKRSTKVMKEINKLLGWYPGSPAEFS